MKKRYPEQVIYMISGEELNKVLSCIEAILNSFEKGSDDYAIVDNLRQKLTRKISYEELLDKMGVPRVGDQTAAPGQEDIEWHKFLGELGLKPANKNEKK